MATELRSQVIQPPYDGLDTDTAPDALPATKAPLLDNFLTHYVGKAPMRGPIRGTDLALASGVAGMWTFGDGILISHFSGIGRAPWVAPYRKAAAAADLQNVATSYNFVNVAAATVASTTLSAAKRTRYPGARYTRTADAAYGMSMFSVDNVNEKGGYQALTKLMRWGTGGLVAADSDMLEYDHAPRACQDVKFHYQRLFALGGCDPDTTSGIKMNTLRYSDPLAAGDDLPDTVDAWKDDVSGLYNQIIIGADDNSDFGVALASIGQNLAIFKRKSIYVLTGSSASTFAVKRFTDALGCIDPRSVVEVEDGCYFMSDQGFMFFDGTQITNTSSGLRSTLLATALAGMGDRGVDASSVLAARLPNGYISLMINAFGIGTWNGLLNAQRGTWSNISGDGFTLGQFGSTRNSTFVIVGVGAATWFVRADYVTMPELAPATQRGFDFINGTNSPIPARWRSKLASLSSPGSRAQIQRFVFDYNFDVNGAADDANSGWYVTLVTGDSTTLQAQYQVPAGGDSTTHAYRRRHSKDCFAEANDFQVQVEWKTSALALNRAELLPSYVLYQVTRPLVRE